jgi:hypothetical protein
LTRETEDLREKSAQCHFVHHKSHPGLYDEKPVTKKQFVALKK